MPDIKFDCSGCQQHLEAPEEMAGDTLECPTCHTPLTVPSPALEEATSISIGGMTAAVSAADVVNDAPTSSEPTPAANICPSCNAAMEEGSVLCVACGFHTGLGKKLSTDLS